MDQFEDDDLAQLESRLREIGWITGPAAAFEPDEMATASKLLGSVKEAHKLANAKQDGKRYRYRPQTISRVDVFYVTSAANVYSSLVGWKIDVIQNGRRRNFARLLDDHRCAVVLAQMENIGYRINLLITEGMRASGILGRPKTGKPVKNARAAEPPRPCRSMAKTRQERSKRFAIMDELKGFKR